jgi:pyruvate,water dikinase
MCQSSNFVWLDDMNEEMVPRCGKKAGHLGLMAASGIPVPDGFVITSDAFEEFVLHAGVLSDISIDAPERDPDDIASAVSTAISKTSFSGEFEDKLESLYREIDTGSVVCRSSSTVEDTADQTFAGQHETFIDVDSFDELKTRIKDCWASLYTSRSIAYARQGDVDLTDAKMAVIVQERIDPNRAGVMFTTHPMSPDDDVLIEGNWGFGDSVVSGNVDPDRFIVDRETMEIVDRDKGEKATVVTLTDDGNLVETSTESNEDESYVLSDAEIEELVTLGMDIEELFGGPQDIEWAFSEDDLFIMQTRPAKKSVIGRAEDDSAQSDEDSALLLEGIGASGGIAEGPVRIVNPDGDLGAVTAGDILVTQTTDPSIIRSIGELSGIVTEEGGLISHAAIVAREANVPCVVNASEAMSILYDGMQIRVDGSNGTIHDASAGPSGVGTTSPSSRDPSEVNPDELLPPVSTLEAFDELVDSGRLHLSPTGRRVADTPGFENSWETFVESVTVDDIVQEWRISLGEFVSYLYGLETSDIPENPVTELQRLTERFRDFYMYNLFSDAYDLSPVVDYFSVKYVDSDIDDGLRAAVRQHADEEGVNVTDVQEVVSPPLKNVYLPLGMVAETAEVDMKSILDDLARSFTEDSDAYIDQLREIELSRADFQRGLVDDVPGFSEESIRRARVGHKAFKEVLQGEERKVYLQATNLLEHFAIMNDFNRLVGSEYVGIVDDLLATVPEPRKVYSHSDWPWNQMLDYYTYETE